MQNTPESAHLYASIVLYLLRIIGQKETNSDVQIVSPNFFNLILASFKVYKT